jgi:group I intron endonuclease
MKTFTVYIIRCAISDKVYVGMTTTGIIKRWHSHVYYAKHGAKWPLYAAIRKYGKEYFTIEILESCAAMEELYHREVYWIEQYKSIAPNGYNLLPGSRFRDGRPSSMLRKVRSDKGKTISEERKQGLRNAKKYLVLSDEARARMSAGKKGKPHPPEVRQKIRLSQPMRGKHHSQEHIAKMREARWPNLPPLYQLTNAPGSSAQVTQ